jgi:hypothetical protein
MAKRPVPLARQDIEQRLGDMVEELEAIERELADLLGEDDEDDYPDLEEDLNRLLGGARNPSRTRRRVRSRRPLEAIPAV